MALKNLFKKLYSTVNGKVFLAIALVVIAGFLFGSIGFSQVIDIDNKKIKKIETFLSTVKMVGNFVISDDKIKSIFNVSLSTARKGADISYGLLVLSAINEFDLIDMVISQQYKQKARDYFNEVIDERMNIIEDARKVGYDFSKVAFSKVMVGSPMSVSMGALVWETISIIDKSIAIFTTINVVRQEMFYDGIWRYFDSRRWGESHNVAWEDAKAEMGIILSGKRFIHGKDFAKEDESKLALQFAILWDKWGIYTDSSGITKQARDEFGQEMLALVKEGSEKYALANEKPIISLFSKAKSFFNKITEEIGRISDVLRGLASQFSLKAITGSIINTLFPQQPLAQNQFLGSSGISGLTITEPSLNQEQIDDLNEQADFLKGQKSAASKPLISPFISPTFSVSPSPSVSPSFSPSPSVSPSPSASPSPTPSLTPTPSPSPSPSVAKCEKSQGSLAAKNRVILNEIAWMGTTSSASDEWIELKNISGTEIDLTGWQLLDKNQDIKIIFPKGAKLLFNGFFLLERTNDETVTGKAADLIYTGGLSNTNEALYLFDGSCQLQDEVLTSSNWPAGNNSSKRTMERKSDLSWQTSFNPGGTPKSENSLGYVETPTYISSGEGSNSPLPTYLKILISEIQIFPAGERFIELYNPNNQNIDLTDWYIQRKTATGTSWNSLVSSTKFIGKSIQQQDYFLIARTATLNPDILLGNLTLSENNVILLKNPNQEIVDKVGWGQAQDFEGSPSTNPQSGESLGRKWIEGAGYQDVDNNLTDFEIQLPTPKAKNKIFSDIIPPETTIDSKPPSLTNQIEATFTFSSSEENSTFECKLDENAWESCQSPKIYTSLTELEHTFSVKAIDSASNADLSPAQYQWQVDSVSPQTEILIHPPFLTNQTQANFVFSSNEENSTFECKLDEGSWETCETPKLFNNLLDGERAFYVRARDVVQNLDSSPAQYTWIIDTLIESPVLSLADLDSDSLFYTNEKRIKAAISNDQEAINWLLSESETATEDPSSLWQNERPLEFILSEGNGPKTVYLWIKDESGNIGLGISAQIILDIAPPSVQFSSLAQIQPLTDFSISWLGSDATSGILEYHLKFREQSEAESDNWQTIFGQNYQFSGLNGKTYYFKIRAKDNADNLSEWSSEISTKIEKPVLEVSPTSLSFEAIEFGQNPANKDLTIGNIGFGDLDWEIVLPETEWLSVNSTSGQAPSNVSVSVNTFGLEASQFQTEIKISSNGGEKEIPIILNLQEDTIPPQAPTITSHSQDQILNSSPITLIGQTEANALILISLNSQNEEVMADENGDWQKEIELAEGQNGIEIRAKDEAGNEGQPIALNLFLDIQPPVVIINGLPEFEPSLSFAVAWSGEDILSGIDGFQFRYSEFEDEENWTYWPSENEYTTAVQYDFIGEDGKIYYFQVKARDNAGNESDWQETSTQIKMPFAQLSLVINEIAWMGTANSADDEWIEFYNNSSEDIDLEGWTLTATDETPDIGLAGVVQSQNYFLLERTNDDAISDISANLIYTGALENEGEKLELFDPYNNMIDSVDYSSGWLVGNNDTKQTMERVNSNQSGLDSANWASNNLITRNGYDAASPPNKINGTPKSKNSVSTSPTTVSSLPFNEFSDITLTYLGSPYIISSTIFVPLGKTLNIEPGVALKFVSSSSPNHGSSLQVNGVLKAIGQESQPITFTRYEQSPGLNWPGIYFSSTSQDSILDWVNIEKARSWDADHFIIKVDQSSVNFQNLTSQNNFNRYGIILSNSSSTINSNAFSGFNDSSQGADPAAIYIKQGNPTVKNSIFEDNTYGIKIEQGASPIIEGNYFEENEKPIYASSSYPSLAGNQFLNNDVDGILIKGNLSQDTIWKAGITYIIDGQLTVVSGAKLIIQPGTIIKFKYSSSVNSRGKFIANGTILAEGTQGLPIVFTSSRDTATAFTQTAANNPAYYGDWNYIEINSTSQGSIFNNIIVRYGGVDSVQEKGAFRILGANVQIKNSIFDNNRVAGIYLSKKDVSGPDASGTFENLIIRNHKATYNWNNLNSVGLWIKQATLPTLNNLQITNNTYGIYWPNGTCQDLIDNTSLIFSNNTTDTECINKGW